MRTTMDRAGRVVIPKGVREAAGLAAGGEVDVAYRDGRIEIEPAAAGMALADDGTIEASGEMPVLTTEEVRETLERVRR